MNVQTKAVAPGAIDQGTAYGRKRNTYDPLLTEVGPGTPMGELLRRYWHPIAVSVEVASDAPKRVRLLSEDLVLFRDQQGRIGLVDEHCCHRGTSLFYGRIEEDGIRCPYHGWKFDTEGHCLDQACETDGGGKGRNAVRQPWYPVQERYGAVWAYIGPSEKKPELPRWEILENLEEGELFAHPIIDYASPVDGVLDFNWLQSYENTLDVMHAIWLHIAHSKENQFGSEPRYREDMDTHAFIQYTSWSETEKGVRYEQVFPMGGEYALHYSVEDIMPNVSIVPNPSQAGSAPDTISWHVPIDDTHFKIFFIVRTRSLEEAHNRVVRHNGKLWVDCTPEERRQYPGDYETQSTQGKIAVHANEHLVKSDTGVVMIRRKLQSLIKDVQGGSDPLNISFDKNESPLKTVAYASIGKMA